MTSRADSLLAELKSRYRFRDDFAAKLHPMVERILDAGTPEEHRPALLELLAESCMRQAEIERNTAQAIAAWRGFVAEFTFLVQQALKRNDRGGRAAG